MKRRGLSIFLVPLLLGGVLSSEEKKEKSLAWLGYLRLPKPTLDATEIVTPTPPLSWKAWRSDEGGEISWIPRYKGYVNVVGRSLKVLPKGPDPKTLTRRQRHQADP